MTITLSSPISDELDEALAPVLWLLPINARRQSARVSPWRARARQLEQRLRVGLVADRVLLERLAATLDRLEARLTDERACFAGGAPALADWLVYGRMQLLEGGDGWETFKARRRLWRWWKAMKELAAAETHVEAYDAEDAELLEAARHRKRSGGSFDVKRLPVI